MALKGTTVKMFGAFTALLLVGTACKGPQAPLEVGVDKFQTDVALGKGRGAVVQPPTVTGVGIIGLTGPPISFTSGGAVARGQAARPNAGATSPRPAVNTPRQISGGGTSDSGGGGGFVDDFQDEFAAAGIVCAGPKGFPVSTSPGDATRAPAPAKYDFRQKDLTSGAISLTHRTVENVNNLQGSGQSGAFTFEVVNEQNGASTRTGYRVVPFATALTIIANAGARSPDAKKLAEQQSGIFITSIQSTAANGTSESLNFAPPVDMVAPLTPPPNTTTRNLGLKIMQFPANVVAPAPPPSWDAEAKDLLTQTEVKVHGEIVDGRPDSPGIQPSLINACGKVLEAWQVKLGSEAAPGTLKSPVTGKNLSFVTTYYFGTQYGGLSLQETDHTFGVPGGGAGAIDSQTLSIINSEPAPAR